ncbi:MAG TPA: glycerate kinase [Bacillota bacterium]|nr:glycerate kinase [Bacillota bacterium]
MHIILAPDSYKGSLTSVKVAAAMERGVQKVFPQAGITKLPIADGGEGTTEALLAATGGTRMTTTVSGPLGEQVDAGWGVLGDGETAVIEMAAASGLALLSGQNLNPMNASTYGTGQLIRAALDRGLRKLIIGIGGSATNDGGAGMASALGVRFLDRFQKELPGGGAALKKLAEIDVSGLDPRLKEAAVLVACDVDNPLCGSTGASIVYGPQKGAGPGMVAELEEALAKYGEVAKATLGKDVAAIPGSGAAGGLGAGLLLFTPCRLRPGIDIILEATGFEDKIKSADLVITGEGCTDGQTVFGKAPVGIARAARQYNVPTVCLSGGLGLGSEAVMAHGIHGLVSIVPRPMSLEACMQSAEELLISATTRLCQLLSVGMQLR